MDSRRLAIALAILAATLAVSSYLLTKDNPGILGRFGIPK